MPEGCRGCCMMILMIPLLICALVACVAIYVLSSETQTPLGSDFRPSVQEAVAFDNEIARASNSAASQGWFYFRFTERELSSWLDLEGRDYADQYGYSFPFEEVQVGISGGRLEFYGGVTYSQITVPLRVEITPKIDSNGHIAFDIRTAQWGGVPLPAFVLDSVTDQIEGKLFQAIKDLPGDYWLDPMTLKADNGVFEVQGWIKNSG